MTESDKKQISIMRTDGKSMQQIGECLGLSVNTVKSYCRRSQMADKTPYIGSHRSDPSSCKHCGKNIRQIKKTKPKTFCSERCRREWWKVNGVFGNSRKAFYQLTCSACGRAYVSYGNKNRKFCSHQCYVKSRFGGICDEQRPVGS